MGARTFQGSRWTFGNARRRDMQVRVTQMDKTTQNAQNVVAMSDFQPETGYAAIAQIESYWEAIRGTRLLPKRSDIDPRGIELALENAFILERVAPGIARLRIAGTHLNDLMGIEVRGMPLTTFFAPEARAEVADLLETVFQTPAMGALRLTSAPGPDGDRLAARMVLLPLKSDLGDVSRVLGGLVSRGAVGTAPRRFTVQSREIRTIVAGVPIAQTSPGASPGQPALPAPQRGLAETPAPFEAKPSVPGATSPRRRPPYLRLVKSDD